MRYALMKKRGASMCRRSIYFLTLFCLFYFQALAQEPGQKCLPGTNCPKEEDQCPPGTKCPQKEKPKLSIKPETIVVTSGFQDGAVSLEPTKTVIDLTKFESSGNVDRIEDVLKHLTGIDVIQGTGGVDPQQMILMRGFDDSRFQVAIDGRPITAPTAGSDTFVDWSSLTSGNIERIEIIRGSASAKYENAAGGVINIITKKGIKGDNLTPKVSVDTSYSSYNTLTTRGTISGGAGDLGYFINFGSRSSDGFLRNNYYDGMDYSGRLDYSLPAKGSLSASFKRSDLEHGYPIVNSANSKYTKDYDPEYPVVADDADTLRGGRLISYPGGKSFKIKKAGKFDFGYNQPIGNTVVSFKYWYDKGSEDSYSYQLSGTKLAQTFSGQDARKERTFGVMFDYQLNLWKRHAITVGYSQRRMQYFTTPDAYRISGAYIDDQYAVTGKLILNMGLRNMFVREYSEAYYDPGTPTTATYRHKIFTRLMLPKFTATYQLNPQTEVFATVSRDYHMPGC
jgi:outer membrane receptor protein involved in Fe transport